MTTLALTSPSSDLTSVGFFHFGKGQEDPVQRLEDAIAHFKSNGGILDKALIVLPEAFNIGRAYYGTESPNVDPSILSDLSSLSVESRCVFVAGLIIDDTKGVVPPYSSAYLIDGQGAPLRLARKALADDAEVSLSPAHRTANYTAHGSIESSPVLHRGVAIAALVCRDAQFDNCGRKHFAACEALARELARCDVSCRVLCIPACVANGFCGGVIGGDVSSGTPWQNTVQVLAQRQANRSQLYQQSVWQNNSESTVCQSWGKLYCNSAV